MLADRRSGIDRRGSIPPQPLALEPRRYGFRDFDERRDSQDRRLYIPPPRYRAREADDDGFIHLTHDELLRLLSEFDR